MPLAFVMLLALGAPSPTVAPTPTAARTYTPTEAATALRGLAAKRPAKLSPADAKTFAKHSAWLRTCAKNLDAVVGNKTKLLELQQTMQQESRSFQTLSNVMKSRHDTAMSIIGNMRI